MLDPDTFLTYVYVMADEFCKGHLAPAPPAPGPDPALARSEVVALAVFGQWARFASERDFYRYAVRHLRPTFPTLPDRSQFNRLLRAQRDALAAFGHHLADLPGRAAAAYEALDGSGWLAGDADIGRSGRRGWYEGCPLLLAVTPGGAVSGFGFGPASAKEQPLAEAFLAARHRPDARYPTPGRAAGGPYLADNGFAGADRHRRWRAAYGAVVLCPPQGRSPRAWPPPLWRWHAGLRQIVETVFDKLHHAFRLRRERPHALDGFQGRLAAKVALHNFCLWLNGQLDRPALAFADLIDW